MIVAVSHWRHWDIALTIAFLIFLMYVPDIIQGIRKARRVRERARQIAQEHDARDFLDRQWKESNR
jgi:hypothetical protein